MTRLFMRPFLRAKRLNTTRSNWSSHHDGPRLCTKSRPAFSQEDARRARFVEMKIRSKTALLMLLEVGTAGSAGQNSETRAGFGDSLQGSLVTVSEQTLSHWLQIAPLVWVDAPARKIVRQSEQRCHDLHGHIRDESS